MRALHGHPVADERGVALVEFALVIPVLLLLVVGTLDFGRAVNAYLTLNSAVREGARAAVLDPASTMPKIEQAVIARSAPLDARQLTVEVTYSEVLTYTNGSPDTWKTPTPWGPPAEQTPPAPLRVRVEASYPWSSVTWVAGRFFGTGSRTFTAAATAEARR